MAVVVIALGLSGTAGAATVVETNVWSQAMGKRVSVAVVLPEACAKEGGRRWPVAYLLHGHGGNHREYLEKTGEVQKAVERYGFIAVCPDGMVDSWWVDSPVDPKVRYETFVAKELVAWCDANLQTHPDRSRRALVGASMGGYGALSIIGRHPDVFGAVGAIHPGVELKSSAKRGWGIDRRLGPLETQERNWDAHSVLNRIRAIRNGEVAIFLAIGTSDEYFLAGNRALHAQLTADGVAHSYAEIRGANDAESRHTFECQALGEREIYPKLADYFSR